MILACLPTAGEMLRFTAEGPSDAPAKVDLSNMPLDVVEKMGQLLEELRDR
jgi:hypothetical protein